MPRFSLISIPMLLLCMSLSACGGGGPDDNRAPLADAGPDVTLDEGQSFTLTGSGSDPDDDKLEFEWVVPEGFAAAASNTAELVVSATPDISKNSSFTFTLTVTDANGASASDDVIVTLRDVPSLAVSIDGIKTLAFRWDAFPGTKRYRLLENADGASGFTEIASLDAGATSYAREIPVHLLNWVKASYLLEACEDADCTNTRTSRTVMAADLVAAQAIGYFKASNTGAGDFFGLSVALSGDGNTLAVGASGEDSATIGGGGNEIDDCDEASPSNCAMQSGAVYIFVRDSAGGWMQQAYLKASNTDAIDFFGSSLALSEDGNTLVASAPGEDSDATGINNDGQANNGAASSGAVYVFTRDDAAWSQQAYIKASNTGADDKFGASVALSGDGNTLVVGAWGEDSDATGEDNNDADTSGAAYVFRREGTTWAQQAYLKASNTDADDKFGGSVALSGDGNTLAVGANSEDSAATGIGGDQGDGADNSGAVYVFTRGESGWSQQAYVKASNTRAFNRFGNSLVLSSEGNTLAVGANSEDSAATGIGGDQGDGADNSGAVYVFTRDTAGDWSQQAYVKASNTGTDDRFGNSVALSGDGNTLAVGALHEDSAATGIGGDQGDGADNSGAVYVFTRGESGWSQQAYVKASNTRAFNRFGNSLVLSSEGNTLAVGANSEDSAATGIGGDQGDGADNSGAVYVFTRDTAGDWSQQAYVKASNTGTDDRFGNSVALSGDGVTLVVGADGEDSAATGIGGNQGDNTATDSGAVYVY